MKQLLLVVIFLVLFSSGAFAVISKDSMKIFAVTSEGQGLAAELILTIEPGVGKVWSSVTPLVGTTTQSAQRTAVQVANIYAGDTQKFDFKFDINSEASVVDGPSAGAAMTLLTVSMLRDQHVPNNIAVTGTIANDGSIGPVGGVFEKSQEASKQGIKVFFVPKGEAKQIVKLPSGVQSVNLIEYAFSQWGLKIVEVENMDQLLKLAYSDIQTIDVNKQTDQNVFDFLPSPIQHAESLTLMKVITQKYIVDGKKEVEDAKKALNSSLLEDNELVQTLLGLLNNSEETFTESELLLDKNFLYSAANYAFLAKVNSMMVKDLAENPSLLTLSSTLFHSKLVEERKRALALESKLGEYIPLDYLEWHIAAQQRAVYAENNLNNLLSNQTIVVDDGSGTTDYSVAIQRVQDFEFAVAWLDIANDFFAESSKSQKKIRTDDVNAFSETVDNLIVQAENGLTILPKDKSEDAKRRYDAAIREKQLGWTLAAGYDAALAISLINGYGIDSISDLNSLYKDVSEKTKRLRQEIDSNNQAFVWANLYLDHANYYLAGTDYYISQHSEAKALESIKSALSISLLAESMLTVSKEYYDYYSNVPLDRIIQENNNFIPQKSLIEEDWVVAVLAIGFIIGWALVVVLVFKFYSRVSKQKAASIQQQTLQIEKMQKQLDESLQKGEISNETYYSLQDKYTERLNLLQSELKEKSEHVVEIDSLRSKLVGLEHVLRIYKDHYETGNILKEDYNKQVALVQKEIDSIKEEIARQKQELSTEEQKIKTQSIVDLKQETEKVEKEEKKTKKTMQKKAAEKKPTEKKSKKQDNATKSN